VDIANDRLWFLTQVMFDLEAHKLPLKNGKEIMSLWRRISRETRNRPMIKGGLRPAGFGHMAWGYASLYYGYDWSDIIAADIFALFERTGLDNKHTGKLYRDLILSSGGVNDENAQVEKLLGRKFTSAAYFKYMTGLDFNNQK
jgi:Zn-dependent oligopeptidase